MTEQTKEISRLQARIDLLELEVRDLKEITKHLRPQ